MYVPDGTKGVCVCVCVSGRGVVPKLVHLVEWDRLEHGELGPLDVQGEVVDGRGCPGPAAPSTAASTGRGRSGCLKKGGGGGGADNPTNIAGANLVMGCSKVFFFLTTLTPALSFPMPH